MAVKRIDTMIPTHNYTVHLLRTERFQVLDVHRKQTTHQCAVYTNINCNYTRQIVETLLSKRSNCEYYDDFQSFVDSTSTTDVKVALQISDFENIEWEPVMEGKCGASSFLVRKGLSRKAQLSLQLRRYISKHPDSLLRTAVPYTLVLETWNAFDEMKLDFGMGTFASFDDHSMRMAPLRQRLQWCLAEQKELIEDDHEMSKWSWILKPSVTNKGYHISVVDEWDQIIDAIEDAENIREWVLQKYISNPLLIMDGHKFHLRVYILCVGALKVFTFNHILMLLAAHKYSDYDYTDVYAHLTNTARAAEDVAFKEEAFVQLLEDLPQYLSAATLKRAKVTKGNAVSHIKKQIYKITAELFAAYENEYSIFCPMTRCFEVFGLDFLVDDNLNIHFLEINPGPDFKQTGHRLNKVIVQLWEQIFRIVLDTNPSRELESIDCTAGSSKQSMTLVYSKEWSAAKHSGGFRFTEETKHLS